MIWRLRFLRSFTLHRQGVMIQKQWMSFHMKRTHSTSSTGATTTSSVFTTESIGAYFVIRVKTNNDFKPMKWKRRFPPESGIQSDAIGYMAGQLTMEKYPDKIRRVIYFDKDSKKKFIFFTNALTISPVIVAEPYHNRWQMELFFKWIKQHLKIKKFWEYFRKRSTHSDLLRNHSLLHDGYCAEEDEC